MSRLRAFVFTLNNYTDVEYDRIVYFCSDKKYSIIGKEVGQNGTPHLQGYCSLGRRFAYANIKKEMPRANI